MSGFYILIPAAPLMAAITIALAGRWLGEASRRVGTLAVGISFGLSVIAFAELVVGSDPIQIALYEFFQSGSLTVDLGLYIDQLTVLLLLLVTGVSFVVHVYSSEYMIGDPRFSRFFAVIALFTFAMVTLVMSSNLLMIFMCWEIMGICSYLLISHQADRKAAGRAATKVFLVNAVADAGLLFGVILTFATFATLDIRQILDQAPSISGQTINLLGWVGVEFQVQTITLITLFLFIGCMGKSAQIPFHIWLPHAMEAPTPVSALIHAATMVNAGPFLLVRFSGLIMLSPVAMTFIAVVGGTTALFAAVVSLTQTDIKRTLAYSTISHIGFMIMACGLGAFVAAIFHMLAHGFLKGFLFLSTGSQLSGAAVAHGHDDSATGGKPPWMLYLGALTLACVPPFVIFSGSYEHLWTAHNSSAAAIAFWVIGMLTVFFTAMYLCRGVLLLFQDNAAAAIRPRFLSPLHLLGISLGALVLITLLMALWRWFVPFLAPALGRPYPAVVGTLRPGGLFPLLALPLLAALGGWALSCLLQARTGPSFVARSNWAQGLYVLFLNKFYFDEICGVYLVQPSIRFANWLWRDIDVRVINRSVLGMATGSVRAAGWLWRVVDVRGVDHAVVASGQRSVGLAQWLWRVVDVRRIDNTSQQIARAADAAGHTLQDVEPRTIQHHLRVLIMWTVVAIAFFYWFVL